MPAEIPPVYLLYGEDDYLASQKLAELSARMGDTTTVAMNTTRLDGTNLSIEQLRSAAGVMPFLSPYRLVIIDGLNARGNKRKDQQLFKPFLDNPPPSAIIVLVENRYIKEEDNWLLQWCAGASQRAQVVSCWPPKGNAMNTWIEQRVRAYSGQITNDAVKELAGLMGDSTRSADQEIKKLLAYVNYQRRIEVEDVHDVCISVEEIWVNQLVEAVLKYDRKKAVKLLKQLLETTEPVYLLVAFTNQIRRLILLGDMLAIGMHDREIKKELSVFDRRNVSDKALTALRGTYKSTSEGVLDKIIHRLLAVDGRIKTGQVPGDLALELLIDEFTTQKT